MAVYYQGKRMNWHIRGMDPKESINLDPATFNPDMLPGNEIIQGNNQLPLVKIPRIPNRLSIRSDGHVELILSRFYDKEAKQSRNRKTIIGSAANMILPGMMMANDTYYDYFNIQGTLVTIPWKEEEKPEENKATPKNNRIPAKSNRIPAKNDKNPAKNGKDIIDTYAQDRIRKPEERKPEETKGQNQPAQTEDKTTEQITDETIREREKYLHRLETQISIHEKKIQRLKEEIEELEEDKIFEADEDQKEHIQLLSYMLDHFKDIVTTQANKKPHVPMSLKQIRTINELLKELKEFFQGCESEDYLHLAEEPDPDQDNPGTTNGEMALLLGAYLYTIHAYLYGDLRTK